jgi:hypothetical protein
MSLTTDERPDTFGFVTEEVTCKVLNVPPRKLQRYREQGGGPPFYKFSQSIRYRIPEVLEWASTQRRLTTTGHRRPRPPEPVASPTVSAAALEQPIKRKPGWPLGRKRGQRKAKPAPASTAAAAE